jgi:hypothetical protein
MRGDVVTATAVDRRLDWMALVGVTLVVLITQIDVVRRLVGPEQFLITQWTLALVPVEEAT